MVKWTAPAKRDLKKIHDYIADDSTYYAKKVVQDIVSKTESLKDSPELGRIVPELSAGRGESGNRRMMEMERYRLF